MWRTGKSSDVRFGFSRVRIWVYQVHPISEGAQIEGSFWSFDSSRRQSFIPKCINRTPLTLLILSFPSYLLPRHTLRTHHHVPHPLFRLLNLQTPPHHPKITAPPHLLTPNRQPRPEIPLPLHHILRTPSNLLFHTKGHCVIIVASKVDGGFDVQLGVGPGLATGIDVGCCR